MDLKGKLLKFKDNKIKASLEGAQYVLTYRKENNPADSPRTSHAILSALKAEGGIVLELNSSLFYSPDKPKDELIYQCKDIAEKLGLKYRYRKVPASGAPSLFARLMNTTRESAHELVVLVPAESWENEDILSLLLPFGARYYTVSEYSADADLLEAFINMTDREKLERFGLIVFDVGLLGHMGINSALMGPGEVKNLLKI